MGNLWAEAYSNINNPDHKKNMDESLEKIYRNNVLAGKAKTFTYPNSGPGMVEDSQGFWVTKKDYLTVVEELKRINNLLDQVRNF